MDKHQHRLQILQIPSAINIEPGWNEHGSVIAVPRNPQEIQIVSIIHDNRPVIPYVDLRRLHTITLEHPITALFLHPFGNYVAFTGQRTEFTIVDLNPQNTLKYLSPLHQHTMWRLWKKVQSHRPEKGALALSANLVSDLYHLPVNIRRAITTSLPHLTFAPQPAPPRIQITVPPLPATPEEKQLAAGVSSPINPTRDLEFQPRESCCGCCDCAIL